MKSSTIFPFLFLSAEMQGVYGQGGEKNQKCVLKKKFIILQQTFCDYGGWLIQMVQKDILMGEKGNEVMQKL